MRLCTNPSPQVNHMSVFEAGAALRTWAARHGLAPTVAAAQVADLDLGNRYLGQLNEAFDRLDAPLSRAINARKVHAVAANETEEKVLVYLSKAFTAKQVGALPSIIGAYEVEYRQGVIGQVGGAPPSGLGSPSHYLHAGRIACGSSVGLGGGLSAGTLGALVRVNGDLFGLSNNHVIGRCSYAEGGHPVLAPGNLDINPNFLIHPFCIGLYESCAPMLNGSPATVPVSGNLDAALMRVVDDSKVSAMQGNAYPTPNSVSPLADGMSVQKVGRTTGHTRGVVTGKVAGFQSVSYAVPELQHQFNVFFSEAWVVEGIDGAFSDSGDSGSLVVGSLSSGELTSVGLVFAGNGSITLVVPLDLILAHFSATIETTLGV